jgi:hypothetical protein
MLSFICKALQGKKKKKDKTKVYAFWYYNIAWGTVDRSQKLIVTSTDDKMVHDESFNEETPITYQQAQKLP